MPVPQKILVAYDDPESDTLWRAIDLADALGATLIVTNVAPQSEPGESVDEADRTARVRLDEARRHLEERGVTADLVPSVGPPAEAIVSLARDRGVDLIVVGTRRKGFFERLVEGSVSQEVIRHAPCDVLVVD